MSIINPPHDCPLCPRLVAFRQANIAMHPTWFNGPIPVWGDLVSPKLIIVGLAPGLQGANRTGRPFTGDYAGILLFDTLKKFGLAQGTYQADPSDDFELINTVIINSVRCVPPQNKPIGSEINNCRQFLTPNLNTIESGQIYLALGRIAHDSFLTTLGEKKSLFPFSHGAVHELSNGKTLIDSYHCSRYNTNTGRLTTQMFENIFITISNMLK